jgi:hypothetical protein
LSGRNCNKKIVLVHWAVDGGVPGVVGLLSLLYDKRAGNAAIPNYPEGLFLDFDFKMSRHKKSPLAQAFQLSVFMRLTLSGSDRLSFNKWFDFGSRAIKKIPAFCCNGEIRKIIFNQFLAHFHRNVVFAEIYFTISRNHNFAWNYLNDFEILFPHFELH